MLMHLPRLASVGTFLLLCPASATYSQARSNLRAQLQAKAEHYEQRILQVISSDDDIRREMTFGELEATVDIADDIDTPDGTVFGGISGIAYDYDNDMYLAVTNDIKDNHTDPTLPPQNSTTSPPQPPNVANGQVPTSITLPSQEGVNGPDPPVLHRPRFYSLKFSQDAVGTPRIWGVTYLRDVNHTLYEAGDVIPQAIAYSDGSIYIALDIGPNLLDSVNPDYTKPMIVEYNSTGHWQGNFTYPEYFRFTGGKGFSALTVNPGEDTLYAATPRGLVDDRPEYVRMVAFDLETRQSGKQYVYEATNSVVGMVSVDNAGGFVVLERSEVIPDYTWVPPTYSPANTAVVNRQDAYESDWEGYDVTLHYALCLDALNVQTVNDLKTVSTLPTMRRDEIYKFENVTRFEAMGADGGYGPYYDNTHDTSSSDSKSKKRRRKSHSGSGTGGSNSRRLDEEEPDDELHVIIMSDNEFEERPTEVLFVELDVHEVTILEPKLETTDLLDDGSTGKFAMDPAIYIHPKVPEKSLILGALAKGDVGVYNLQGELKQTFPTGGGQYVGIDVMYAFRLKDDKLVDVALVADQSGNKLETFLISPERVYDHQYLSGITETTSMPSINSPRGVAGYQSPYTGKYFAFVISNGDIIQQVELKATDDGERIKGDIVRTISVGATAGGVVVDQELGFLYVSIANNEEKGILKYDAEPDEYNYDDEYPATVVGGTKEHFFSENDVEGITLYYGDQGDGYLVVSVSGDSTFAVFEREKDNDYYDSFTIGKNTDNDIDRTDNTEGIAITNVYLGSEFKCGLFVAQDFDNDVAKVDGLPDGVLQNSNTNFKLVPYQELADNLSHSLDIDTDSWSPRRFALVVLVNCLAQDIYSALNDDKLSGRDTEALLGYLNDATKHLYPRASKKQQMISLIDPFDTDLDKKKKRSLKELPIEERRQETRRRLAAHASLTASQRRELSKSDCDRRRRRLAVDLEDAVDELDDFRDHLDDLYDKDRLNNVGDDKYNEWRDLAKAIKDQLSHD